jgi:hypothetical protein
MAELLKYPRDLEKHPNLPRINFTSRNPKDKTPGLNVSLYAPQSINFSDGMGFGNFDLGMISSTIASSMDKDGKIDVENVKNQMKAAAGVDGLSRAILAKSAAAVGIGGGFAEKIADVSLLEAKAAINPNTVLQFTGPVLRTYAFEFTMAGTSVKESEDIQKIITSFRERMYPTKQGQYILSYPDVFQVTFNLAKGNLRGNFVPQYAESYLTGMTTTYNASGNAFHDDGAPTDVSVQLQFSEFKALTREDIKELSTGGKIKVLTTEDRENLLIAAANAAAAAAIAKIGDGT